MIGALDILPTHMDLVRETLRRHLPPDTRVWVFGSRVSGKARRYSDLDLAVDSGRPLEPTLLLNLSEELEECDLPYKVDIVDWQSLDTRFRSNLERQRVPLPLDSNSATHDTGTGLASPT